MNPNEVLAQQQAYMNQVNQVMQNVQHMQWALLAIWAAGMLISFGVIYMFYARLRDIADELRMFRVAYQMVHDRRQPGGSLRKPTPDSPGNPFQEGGEEQHKPKSS
jgi:hypothetical protein